MISLGRIFKKNNSFLRRLKLVYVLNNVLNRRHLLQNRELYRKYGLRRSIYLPLGHHHFSPPSGARPWLDHPDAFTRLLNHPEYQKFPADIQRELMRFVEDGYMILKGFYSSEEVARLNREVDKQMEEKNIDFNFTGRKIMDAFRDSKVIDREYFRNQRLIDLLQFIMGRPVIPFQTINFIEGSEQRAHSDSIHMTTEPLGHLIAAWTALEDCSEENGPLFYYPGSHRLPYVTAKDYPAGHTFWTIGRYRNERYEDKIEEVIKANKLKKKVFTGKAGDVFIWHANLLHGGSPIAKEGATRRSMVAHYYTEGVICYHEMSQRPALI